AGDLSGPLLQAVQVVLAMGCQRRAGFGELMVPRIQHSTAGTTLEQGIALLQRPAVAAPQGEKIRFHVEQPPIEEASPRFTAPTDQCMAARLKGNNSQGRTQHP